MTILCIILFIIILSGVTYYIINRKKLEQHIKENYLNINHKEPTIEEISKELKVDTIDVIMALEAIQEPVSIFKKWGEKIIQ